MMKRILSTTTFSILFLVSVRYLVADAAPDYSFHWVKRKKARSSSHLVERNKARSNYAAAKAVDRKLSTAWCEGKRGNGIGESLSIQFKPVVAEGIFILNGFAATRYHYYANNRIKDVEITLKYRNGRTKKLKRRLKDNLCFEVDERVCDDNNEAKMRACLKKQNRICHYEHGEGGGSDGASVVKLKAPVCLVGLKVKILSVYRGKKYRDTCIAEIRPARSTYLYMTSKEYKKKLDTVEANCK